MKSIDAGWASFYFALLNRHSWLYRKVEHQEYAGKNLWAKNVSLDINYEQTREYYRIFVLGQPEDKPVELTDEEISRRNQCLSELPLPVSCVEKTLLFSDYSLRDKNGDALSLAIGDVCAYFSVTALCGAVIEEARSEMANPGLKAHEMSDPLNQNALLLQFLQYNWIGNRLLPELDSSSFDTDAAETEAILNLAIQQLEQKSKHPDERKSLEFYFNASVSFRFFMRLFYRYSVLWATIDANKDANTLIKVSTVASKDIFQRGAKTKPGKVDIRVPYDGIPYSENYHLEITTPSGTRFYPLRLKDKTEVTPFTLHRSSFDHAIPPKDDNGTPEKSVGVRASADEQCEKTEKTFPDSIQPKGSFSGRSISAWSTPLFTDSDDDEPIRRIPSCKDPGERRYDLQFTLAPLPGKKSIAYKLVFIISALYWLLFTVYAAASGDAGVGMLNIVLLVWGFVMPAIAVYISLTGNEPHIPRRLYKRPRRLCWICLAVDYLTAILVLLSLALPHACSSCEIMGMPIHWITLAIGVCVPTILYFVLWSWTRSIDVDRVMQVETYGKLHDVDILTD